MTRPNRLTDAWALWVERQLDQLQKGKTMIPRTFISELQDVNKQLRDELKRRIDQIAGYELRITRMQEAFETIQYTRQGKQAMRNMAGLARHEKWGMLSRLVEEPKP